MSIKQTAEQKVEKILLEDVSLKKIGKGIGMVLFGATLLAGVHMPASSDSHTNSSIELSSSYIDEAKAAECEDESKFNLAKSNIQHLFGNHEMTIAEGNLELRKQTQKMLNHYAVTISNKNQEKIAQKHNVKPENLYKKYTLWNKADIEKYGVDLSWEKWDKEFNNVRNQYMSNTANKATDNWKKAKAGTKNSVSL